MPWVNAGVNNRDNTCARCVRISSAQIRQMNLLSSGLADVAVGNRGAIIRGGRVVLQSRRHLIACLCCMGQQVRLNADDPGSDAQGLESNTGINEIWRGHKKNLPERSIYSFHDI